MSVRDLLLFTILPFTMPFVSSATVYAVETSPNIVLVMADDMGWGQTGYYNHPVLKTPNLDAMAAHGLRFDRFYAGAPNCSPTRATVMTGRTNDRTGTENHGVPMRPQERTIAQMAAEAGYATGHFGKWHLNGMRGPGAPILKDDIRSPGAFGFQTWLSVTNFFDRNPILSRMGVFEEFQGDSSEIIVDEALKFIQRQADDGKPFLAVIWYGSPHSPFVAADDDKVDFAELKNNAQDHYGELVAMDRSIGTLRKGLRELKVSDDTLVWFCSDNGGLPGIEPGTVGDLRGFKGTVYEGGLRVPCVIEWPAGIRQPRVTSFPACTVDILPTVADLLSVEPTEDGRPLDGMSLKEVFRTDPAVRTKPIGFRHTGRSAYIDGDFKLVLSKAGTENFELYDVVNDRKETQNLISQREDVARELIGKWRTWNASVEDSVAGKDYPEGKVVPRDPGPRTWTELDEYAPFLKKWKDRPEFRSYINKKK
ncbi:MAG: sulfatase-like hydrolase/transferase [Planctomycetaceae bacterium]|nr:sulfatase-like hydrolase/transferase [Planctomycetaceae bacterium]